MNAPDPKANTTTEAYLAYKAGYLEESELKPVLYEPYLHFDAWLAYWAGLTNSYPGKKNLFYGESNTEKGVTGTLSRDGVVSVVGTATATEGVRLIRNDGVNFGAGTYTFSISEPQTSVTNLVINTNSGSSVSFRIPAGSTSATNTIPEGSIGVTFVLYYGVINGTTYNNSFKVQLIAGDTPNYDLDPYTTNPEMLCDEEALVAYLAGVTDTYPEEIKDPYDVRIVGYLRHLASIRWPEPDYPVNNEEFYLSTMEPTHTSNPVPSSDIELDTAEAPFIDVKAYGDTSQTTYTGKNLISTINSNGGIEITGLNSFIANKDTARTANIYFSSRLPAGTYTISYDVEKNAVNTEGIRCGVFVVNESGTGTTSLVNLPSPFVGHKEYTFTSTTQVDRLYFFINNEMPSGSTATVTNLQVEAGSTATNFEPYVGGIPAPNPDYPQDIQVVTGEQTVTVTGKNAVNLQGYSSYGVTGSVNGDGTITISGAATSTAGAQVLRSQQPLKAGTYTMTISRPLPFLLNFSIANGVNFRIPAGSTSVTTTLPEDYINQGGLFMAMTAGTTYNETFNLQIVAGSTPDYDFEPYHLQSYTVDLGSIELCKIGDYQDYIYKSGDDWYVHKALSKYVFNGNETINYQSAYGGFTITSGNLISYMPGIQTPLNGYSNYFTIETSTTTWTGEGKIGLSASGTFWAKSTAFGSTQQSCETWLSTNTPTVYYALATPTDTKITDATLVGQLDALAGADTYNEKTFIKVTATDPNLPALLEVEAYKY